jgi:hypothetical protein
MPKKILTKSPSQKISFLFEGDNDALACRNILSWYTKSIEKKQVITEFDVTQVGYWLLEKHRPFIEEYSYPPNSHTTRANRLQSKRPYIKNRLNRLVELGLIEERGTKLAAKGVVEKQVYAFTVEGHLWSWFSEARYATDENRRLIAINNFFGEMSACVSNSHTSFTDSFVEYVNRGTSEGLFYDLCTDEYFDQLVVDLFPLTENYFRFFRFSFLLGLYTHEDTSRILLEIIERADELTKKLMLTQLKLDIESNYYDEMNTSKAWEFHRHTNLSDHTIVTLQGYCLDCKSLWPYTWKILDFLKMGSKPHCYAPDGQIYITGKIICPNCKKPNSRFGVPVIYVPTRALGDKNRISPEQIEKSCDIIQNRGPKTERSKLVETKSQKIIDE